MSDMVNTTTIIGNWKMNLTVGEASLLLHQLDEKVKKHRGIDMVLAPGFLALQPLSLQIDPRKFKLAAQNCYWRDEGAYTGEVSAHQLRGLTDYVLVGHSERRNIFAEQGRDISKKVEAVVRHNMTAVLCVGEAAFERANNETNDVLHDQLIGGLRNVTSEDMENVIIAYEPVWAIGSGQAASARDVTDAAKMIRAHISYLFGVKVAKEVSVLYGGSVTEDNAGGFVLARGVDGLLVGGASLHADKFASIVESVFQVINDNK